MRAVVTTGNDTLDIVETATPAPGPGEVLVRVLAAAVNPVDIWTRQGIFHRADVIEPGRPTGLGWDVTGTVEAVGPDVHDLALGTTVAAVLSGFDIPLRAYADFVVAPAAAVAIVPDGLDPVAAATLPLNALTAAQALDLISPASGDRLLITGAAGAVGGFALPLAVRNGWQVGALARSGDADFLRSAGALEVLTELPTSADFDAVLDAAELGAAAFAAVRDGGSYVGVVPTAVPVGERGISTSAVASHHDGPRLASLLELAATGVLAARVAGTLPLADAAQAQTNVEKGGQRGRWVLIP